MTSFVGHSRSLKISGRYHFGIPTKTVIVTLALIGGALAYVGTGYALFGNASYVMPGNNSGRAVQLTSFGFTTYSGIDFGVPAGLTFANITSLSTDYNFTHNSCGGGSPRFQINVVSGVNTYNINVYIGPPPNYTGCTENMWLNTGNLVDPTALVDTSQLPGGNFYDTFADADSKYGTLSVTGIQLVADGGWFFMDQTQTVLVDNVVIDGSITTFEVPSSAFQVHHFVNLNVGDSYVNITNDGSSGGNICVNVYAFDPSEELVSCCACNLTPNALQSLSLRTDLLSNTLTPATPTSVTVKILAAANPSGTAPAGTLAACDASTVTATTNFATGQEAWGATIHATPQGTYRTTETEFSNATLSAAELQQIAGVCGFAETNGSGYGICKSCQPGGLGATKQ